MILVGEIRDVDTARIAIQSALTGHMVLSSLHATEAVAGLYRLMDMGIESFLIASAMSAVVAQRLVRRSCPDCQEPYQRPPRNSDSCGPSRERHRSADSVAAPDARSVRTPASSTGSGSTSCSR